MRGEHAHPRHGDPAADGSPPHARGTRAFYATYRQLARITPACAGNTAPRSHPWLGLADHPRMRGEHSRTSRRWPSASGSPPHARGTQSHAADFRDDVGITPACAGNTRPRAVDRISTPDHPRMRGEHEYDDEPERAAPGSPPHARGTPLSSSLFSSSFRITPACAGNTIPQSGRRRILLDHPRMRGEHMASRSAGVRSRGSPPHARGTPAVVSRDCLRRWITPACAGNTATLSRAD